MRSGVPGRGAAACAVLEALGGMDVSEAALPFMGWAEGTLGGHPVRIYRISFSGELSFEIATPADRHLHRQPNAETDG